MKRVIILFIILAPFITVANAQFFVEGNISVGHFSGEDSNTGNIGKNSSNLSFNISPKVGYWLNDNISVGTAIYLSQRIVKEIIPDPNDPEKEIEWKNWDPRWSISLFERNKLWQKEKFSLIMESSVFIGGGSTKEKTGSVTKKSQSMVLSTIGINMFPSVTYNLTDKFTCIATCDFLRLEFSYNDLKYYNLSDGTERRIKQNDFGFNTSSSIFNNLTYITIGFIYNF